jgi:HPt (histidine-containing phosphotransfer) domain-containing protein
MMPTQSLPPATTKVEERTGNDADQRRRLALIPGLDLERGLAMIRGNVQKYTRVLVVFANSNQLHADRIAALLAAGDLAAIDLLAQSLKGSAGMLGALNVAEAARAVVSALRDQDGAARIQLLCANLGEALSTLIDGIRQATAGGLEPVATEVDAANSA